MARAASKILSVEDKKEQMADLRGQAKLIRESMKAIRTRKVAANKAVREATKVVKQLDKDLAADQKVLDKIKDKIEALKNS